jgi:hypothetical protein
MSIRNGMPAADLPVVTWRKSRRSGPQGGNCVEIANLPDGQVAIRNSRHPAGPALVFTPDEWDAFVGGAKDGDFDLLRRRGCPFPDAGQARGGRWSRQDHRPLLPPTTSTPATADLPRRTRRDGAPPASPPPTPRRREASGDGKVEFPVLGPDQEALPFVAVVDVGRLAPVL